MSKTIIFYEIHFPWIFWCLIHRMLSVSEFTRIYLISPICTRAPSPRNHFLAPDWTRTLSPPRYSRLYRVELLRCWAFEILDDVWRYCFVVFKIFTVLIFCRYCLCRAFSHPRNIGRARSLNHWRTRRINPIIWGQTPHSPNPLLSPEQLERAQCTTSPSQNIYYDIIIGIRSPRTPRGGKIQNCPLCQNLIEFGRKRCEKTCKEWQSKYPTCRCPDWPVRRQFFLKVWTSNVTYYR